MCERPAPLHEMEGEMTKPTTVGTDDTALTALLLAAYEARRNASQVISVLSVYMLAKGAREVSPEAHSIRFEWSDQGDFLSVLGLWDEDGQEVEPREVEDWRDDNSHLAWNLGGDCRSQWEKFAKAGEFLTRYGDEFTFVIDDVLAMDLSKELAPKPPEPVLEDSDT